MFKAQCSIKTGLYGGSFNPIHKGHTQLSQALLDAHLIDEMWLLVSPQNPFKVNQKLLDDNARLQLARLAVKDIPNLTVCDYEFRLPRPSYMVNTLKHLRQDYPEREFVLIIGADNWERFPNWYRYEEILAHHQIIIYPRTGYQLKDVPADITIADTPFIDISSTEIREKIKNPGYHGEGLCPAVWHEIKKKGYYAYED
ncbi:MAG: nicotinate-nucleotide adenylyltransferase [Bacteroidaceae bacterium]|nr:nicotinate-nucleotide adenylyltransferase [Bacteroidaceae bacterium]